MAEQSKYKSPEELGEAVGKKIEELFGGLFGEDKPQAESPSVSKPAPAAAPVQPPPPQVRERTSPPPRMAPPDSATAKLNQQMEDPKADTGAFDRLIEQIEILILSMEWEVNPQSAKKLLLAIQELGNLLPQTGQAKTIVAMNLRVLQHSAKPDMTPHPALMRFLQESIGALKILYASRGKKPLDNTLVAALTSGYKEIMSGAAQETPRAASEVVESYSTAMNRMGNVVHSLEEIGRRLARILGVLRQGGKMSVEEIIRRLGTLEGLLSERMIELSACHKELVESPPKRPKVQTPQVGNSSEGLWLMVWFGTHIAIPSNLISGVHPLTKEHAQGMMGQRKITLGPRVLQLLPLKRPEGARPLVPTWLVHLSHDEKDFFLLVDKSVGFRRSPTGLDVDAQQRIKIGQTSYVILNRTIFGK